MPISLPNAAARWWALAILAMTQLVIVLDSTIVAIALPQAQIELGMTDGERQWVITAYVLTFGALLLLGGRIADYWGRKRTFMVGMLGFGVASVWGGLAQSGVELVLARGVQGVFAALLAPAALSMLTVIFPHGKDRNFAFAIFGIVSGTGAAIGYILGGVLTEFTSWRWCLLVNVVFVLIGMIGGAVVLKESRAEGERRYDVWGAITVTLGFGFLVYGFTRAEHGWGKFDTIFSLTLGVILLAVFIWIQARIPQPMLPLRVILHGVRGGAFLIQAVVGAVMIGSLLYLTFHLQIVLGMAPLIAGLAMVAMTVVIFLCTPIVMRSLNRYGPRPLMIVGPLLSAAGLFYLAGVSPEGSYWSQVFPALVALGIGLSMLFVPLQNLALTGVAPQDSGVAAATVNSALNIGGSIGLAVFTLLYSGTVDGALAGGTDQIRALTNGYSAAFLASGAVMVAASLLAIFLIRGKKDELMPQWDREESFVRNH